MTIVVSRPTRPSATVGLPPLRLEIPAENRYLPLATGFAQHSAQAFGLSQEDSISLSLAVEEILAALAEDEPPVKLLARNGWYYTEIEIAIPYTELSLGKMNLTAAVEDEEDLEQMGWMLAARMVDRFTIEQVGKRSTHFRLRKHRVYPSGGESASELTSRTASASEIRAALPAELERFGSLFAVHGQGALDATLLEPAERLADFLRSGEYEALLAVNDDELPLGAVLVDRTRSSLASLHGPYLLSGQPESLGRQLLDATLKHLAMSETEGVVFQGSDGPTLPEGVLPLGRRHLRRSGEEALELTTFYRPLREDQGFLTYGAGWLNEYLRSEYDRLGLPRDIVTWKATPGTVPDLPSLLACDVGPLECVIRPVLPGRDTEANLAAHVRLLDGEGCLNILFELDLGQPGHLAFGEALHKSGFRPLYLLPSAGKGDLLLLEATKV